MSGVASESVNLNTLNQETINTRNLEYLNENSTNHIEDI